MLAKFAAPEAPRFLFARPELKARLGRWREFPLTRIAAPAGYGKTTLAAECWREWPGAKAWITLDEVDAEPERFLATLALGLGHAHPFLAGRLGPGPGGFTRPDPESLLDRILGALADLPCQLLTVIDDCALLSAPPVRRLAARFLAAAPSHACFLILTRDAESPPISRRRLRQEVLEFGPADLALSLEECAGWLEERLGIRGDPEVAARVHGLCEGWLAGLQLLALKLDKAGDRRAALEAVEPGHPFLFQYLLEDVLHGLPLEWRRFLLETSILRTLLPDLCDEVRQAGNSAFLLDALHRAQCFLVPLADGAGYRYHRLFGESLQGLLSRGESALVSSLHRRAARWHLVRGPLDSALRHALAAGDGDTLESLAGRALENLFGNSDFGALQAHLGRIPPSLCPGRPWLSIFCAWACFHSGREPEGEARLRDAERILLMAGPEEKASRPAARAQWAHVCLLKAILARLDGAAGKALGWVRRGEAQAPAEALFLRASLAAQAGVILFLEGEAQAMEAELRRVMRMAEKAGHHLAYFGAAYSLSEALGLRGRLDEAGLVLEACARRADSLGGGGPAAGYARIARARWLRRQGRGGESMEEVLAGVAAGRAGGNIRMLNYGHATAAQLHLDAGDAETALQHMELAEGYALRNRMHWAVDLDDLRALRIRCLGPARERPSADAWMARERPALARPHWSGLDRCRTACAYMRWRGDEAGANRLAFRWAEHFGRGGWQGAAGEFRSLAVPEGGTERAAPQAAGESAAVPGRELSERELEVLRAMRDGKSNKEIAGSLFVAPSTVKTHLKNIFTKLEVNNRMRAVSRATESGILR